MSGWGTIYDNTVRAMHSYSSELARLQEQITTGARVIRASDDPSSAHRILELTSRSQQLETFRSNVIDITNTLESSSSALSDISKNLTRVQSLVSQAASSTYSGENRVVMAGEIDSILEQMVSLANTKSLGRYNFSGASTTSQPFLAKRENGKIVSVIYQGSNSELPVPVGVDMQYSGLLVGEKLFGGSNRSSSPVFAGHTGAAAGSGTSSIAGSAWLEVTHSATSYTDPSGTGIKAGTSSAAKDTAIGSVTITIDATNKTIKMGSGESVSYGPTDKDLKLTDESGRVLYVDVSSAALGAMGGTVTVTAESAGKMTLNSDSAAVDVKFMDNQAVTDEQGHVLYVNTANVKATGIEPVSNPGTHNIFETLINVRDLMLNSKNLSSADQMALISKSLDAVKEVTNLAAQSITIVGGRLQAMDSLDKNLEDLGSSTNTQISTLQDSDFAVVAASLARAQTLYEMTLASSTKLLSLSLMDYIN